MMIIKSIRSNYLVRHIKDLLIIAVLGIFILAPANTTAFDLLIGTEDSGSFSHFTGRTICRIINKNMDDMQCSVVPGVNQTHNLTNLQGGSLDMCLVDSRLLYNAVAGKGDFEFLDISYDTLREMISLYNVPATLVVRTNAGVKNVDDLKGKRVNAGPPRSSQRYMMDAIMQSKKWSTEDFSLFEELPQSLSQDTMAFCQGSIQAMLMIGVHPDPALQQLLRICNASLVNMDVITINAIMKSHPALIGMGISPNTYDLFPGGVATFGTTMKLVSSISLDDETVFSIIETLETNRKNFEAAHPALESWKEITHRRTGASIPLHDGAAKYFNK